jgi:hypothetical protein
LIAIAIYGVFICALFTSADHLPPELKKGETAVTLVAMASILLPVVIVYWAVPRAALLRLAGHEERLNFPLEWDTKEIRPLTLSDAIPTVSVGKPWKCTNCREDNPGEFDICWSCQHERAGV